jgi:hypothetical protein
MPTPRAPKVGSQSPTRPYANSTRDTQARKRGFSSGYSGAELIPDMRTLSEFGHVVDDQKLSGPAGVPSPPVAGLFKAYTPIAQTPTITAGTTAAPRRAEWHPRRPGRTPTARRTPDRREPSVDTDRHGDQPRRSEPPPTTRRPLTSPLAAAHESHVTGRKRSSQARPPGGPRSYHAVVGDTVAPRCVDSARAGHATRLVPGAGRRSWPSC